MRGGAFLNGKEGFCPLQGEPKGSKRLLKVGFRKKRGTEGVEKTIEGRFSKKVFPCRRDGEVEKTPHLFSDEEHFLEMEVDFLQPFLDIEARTALANPGKVAMT